MTETTGTYSTATTTRVNSEGVMINEWGERDTEAYIVEFIEKYKKTFDSLASK